MKVIFVGMHNKPNTPPLSSSTRSGSLIDSIIRKIPSLETLKTNMWDVEEFPQVEEKTKLSLGWHDRIKWGKDDVIILLGAEVHKNFVAVEGMRLIKIGHPSAVRSFEAQDLYVSRAVGFIKSYKPIKI